MATLLLCVLMAAAPAEAKRDSATIGVSCDDFAPVAARLSKAKSQKGKPRTPVPADRKGAIVTSVRAGSPGAAADIREGDVIFKVGDSPVADAGQFASAVASLPVGELAEIRVRRMKTTNTSTVWEARTIGVHPKSRDAEIALEKLRAEVTGPLEITSLSLRKNIIGLPEVVVVTKNRASENIVAFEIEVRCYNKFDEPVNDLSGGNVFIGICQDAIKVSDERRSAWQLSLHRITGKVKARVIRVKLEDGTDWKADKKHSSEMEATL